jgi:hypothetical protein
MCLITQQLVPNIAENDITVYKFLKKLEKHYESFLYTKFKYFPGVLVTTVIRESTDLNFYDPISRIKYDEIIKKMNLSHGASRAGHHARDQGMIKSLGSGFHSFRAERKGDSKPNVNLKKRYISLVECTIPKGSLYYEDATGLIVSNQLIVNKSVRYKNSRNTLD